MLHNDVSKYLTHKLHLAEHSAYYHRVEAKPSVRWAYEFKQWLKYNAAKMTERDLAYQLFQARQHLERLLPYQENKSYESSQKNLTKIINRCTELLRPKQQAS